MTHSEIRDTIDGRLQEARWEEAHQELGNLWKAHATTATAAYIIARYKQLTPHLRFRACRVAIVRSFTIEPMAPLIRAAGLTSGIDFQITVGGFGSYAREMIDPASALYGSDPDVIILALQTQDIAPDLWTAYADLSEEEIRAAGERILTEYAGWLRALRAHGRAHLIVHSLALPSYAAEGILDAQSPHGQINALREINRRLTTLVTETRGAYLLDYDGLVARRGRDCWYDEHRFVSTGMSLAATSLLPLANEWMRYLFPLSGKLCKVVVTDLDNTLWGGIIGEDGPANIVIGADSPGAPFRNLQRTLLDLSRRGILLAVCSKNDESLALDTIERHPDMLIRRQHLAAFRINWADKATNLRSIASELNIGLDAIAFLDDNPAERSLIRAQMPEVTVIDLPEEPAHYARLVREHPAFERLVVSEEDRMRGLLYGKQRERQESKNRLPTLEDFFWSLAQEVDIVQVDAQTIDRVAQLTERTNQFNLTNRRYSRQHIAHLCAQPDWECYSVRVRDRFGDNGLVGAILMRLTDDACELDTFVLSCRVLGRTVESAVAAALADRARALGKRRVVGRFYPTERNAMAGEFFDRHGFACVSRHDDYTQWSLSADGSMPICPKWIQLKIQTLERTAHG